MNKSAGKSGKSGGWTPIVIIVLVVTIGAFIAGRMYGERQGVMKERIPAEQYYDETNVEEYVEGGDYEPNWSEDSPSNYADDYSLE